jgi:HEAT repeat protein
MGTLAQLARDAEKRRLKLRAMEILVPWLDDRHPRTRGAAVAALRSLGIAEAIPPLERVAASDPDRGLRRQAEEAIEAIRKGRKPSEDEALQELRQAVERLEKRLEALEDELPTPAGRDSGQ